ncbi:MAG: hypothetical protein LAN84_09550 [Acidobacteriia bacterium]|nr:hypothetical protein [Terriglobia bacterium]
MPASSTTHPFPVLRWLALLWMALWLPAYAWVWGWANLLLWCDAAVILTCLGLRRGSRLLLSSQAVSTLVAALLWGLDAGWRLALGRHLFGGTEYLWDARYPAWVRLLSLFHVGLPAVLLWTLRKTGYDRRGLAAQSGIAAALLLVSRFVRPELNLNFAFRDPLLHRAWGPGPVHLGVIFLGLLAVAYVPAHLLLRRVFPEKRGAMNSPPAEERVT